jgi:tyrosine-protein kinase Etk/Wzc
VEQKPERQADDEINLLDHLIILLKRKWLILGGTVGITLLAGIIVFILPNEYQSDATFLPPQGASSSFTSTMLSQMGPGISALAGGLLGGVSNPGYLYVGILTSRTVLDKIIDRFGLMERYKTWKNRILPAVFPLRREDCRKKLTEDIMTAQVDENSGIVSVTIYEKDPKIAADMANAFVEEMRTLSKGMAISDAAQRRLFYEEQLKDVKVALVRAEDDMRNFQEKTGALQPEDQARAVIEGDAALRAQIAAKEVEIKVMRTFSTPQNPDLQKAEEVLRGMKAQMSKLEVTGGNGYDPLMPTGRMPAVGLEYMRKLRNVKFNETLYEILTKLYESLKLEEARDAAIIQVIDKAVVATKSAKPKRLLIIALSVFVGFFLSVMGALVYEYLDRASVDPANSERIELFRKYARWRKKKE